MKVVIFGSTGRTGRILVQKAIEEGWMVTAFARMPSALQINHPRLTIFQGDATISDQVDEVIEGQDAVLSAVGTDLGQTNLRHASMENIVSAMKKHGVKRIIGIGGMGVLQASETIQIYQTKGFPEEYIPVSNDHNAAYQTLVKSGLDFTFVCPPMIVDGPSTGHYTVSEDYPPHGEFKITTSDLADFMISELKNPQFSGHRVGIATQTAKA